MTRRLEESSGHDERGMALEQVARDPVSIEPARQPRKNDVAAFRRGRAQPCFALEKPADAGKVPVENAMRPLVDDAMMPKRRERHPLARRHAVVGHEVVDDPRALHEMPRTEDTAGAQTVEPVRLGQAVRRDDVASGVNALFFFKQKTAYEIDLVDEQVRADAG